MLHPHSKTPSSFPGLVEFFLQLLLPLRCLVDFRNLGNTVSLLLTLFPALFLVRFLKIPAENETEIESLFHDSEW